MRIAFESLDKYRDIENRNTKIWESELITKKVNQVLGLLDEKKDDEALLLLHQIFQELSSIAESNW